MSCLSFTPFCSGCRLNSLLFLRDVTETSAVGSALNNRRIFLTGNVHFVRL